MCECVYDNSCTWVNVLWMTRNRKRSGYPTVCIMLVIAMARNMHIQFTKAITPYDFTAVA